MPAPNTTTVAPGVDRGAEHRRAEPGGQAAREQAGRLERRLLGHLGQRDLGHHRRLGEGRAAHEVTQRLPSARQARGAVRQVTRVLLLANRHADVRLAAAAVDALAALGAEQRDHVVAGLQRAHPLPHRLDHTRRPRGRARTGHIPRGPRPRRSTCRCGRCRRRAGGPAPRRALARRAPPPAPRAAPRTAPAPPHELSLQVPSHTAVGHAGLGAARRGAARRGHTAVGEARPHPTRPGTGH